MCTCLIVGVLGQAMPSEHQLVDYLSRFSRNANSHLPLFYFGGHLNFFLDIVQICDRVLGRPGHLGRQSALVRHFYGTN
jgi:hypothetical protein